MSVFTLTSGVDTFTGSAGESNTFFFVPADLQPTDTITGGATGGFVDVLSVTAASMAPRSCRAPGPSGTRTEVAPVMSTAIGYASKERHA